MGRPTRAGERASKTVRVKVTRSELKTIRDLAKSEGCKVSDLVRMAVSEFAVKRGTVVEIPLTIDYHRTGFVSGPR